MKSSRIILNVFLLAGLLVGGFSQALTDDEKIAQLRQQIEVLEQQAEELRGSIAQTQEEADTIQKKIDNINAQVKAIQLQIQSTGVKIQKTGIEIVGVQGSIGEAQQKIELQKTTIAGLLLAVDKRDSESLLEILLKNRDLSDYFRQVQYVSDINSTLLSVVDGLKKTKEKLGEQKSDLEVKKNNLEQLKREQDAQRVVLSNAQSQQKTLLKETKGQEAQYQKILVDIEQKRSVFFTQLRELETKIIQGGLYIVHVTADSNLPNKKDNLFSPPESRYRTTQGYGCTSYARCGKARGAYGGAPHNGIDIAAGYGSPIMAIGDGEIIANGKNDGWGNWVAIKHPNQYNLVSVYGHMSTLSFLQVGTQVHSGQVIGYEGNTGNVTGSHLHLSIYKDFFTYVNGKNDQLYFNYFEGSVNPLNYL